MHSFGTILLTAFSATLCVFAGHFSVNACGTERWPVKVVQDRHQKYFFKNRDIDSEELVEPVETTVAKLSNQPWPFNWSVGAFPLQWTYHYRHGQAEFTIWRLKGTLLKRKKEDDEDYHLVIKSGNRRMIAEIPSPSCVEGTPEPIKTMIVQTREEFDDWYAVQPDKNNLNAKVRITGIGYFDRVHGGEGQVLNNGVELHPVIKIEFID